MEELARHGYSVSPGTLYPTLHHLEELGYLASQKRIVAGRRRRCYTATLTGRAALTEARQADRADVRSAGGSHVKPVARAGRAVASFLGLKKNMVALLAMIILVGLGERMAERFLPLYLIALGGGTLSVGLLNGLDNLLSALYSFPGGYASDRLGYKRALILFNLVAMLGYAIVILFPIWEAVILGAVFFLSWTAISLPATMSMVAHALPKNKRTMGVSLQSLVRRVPMALGPILGGIMIGHFGETTGVRLAFVAALILGGVSLIMQQRMIEDTPSARSVQGNALHSLQLITPDLRRLLVSDILVRFCEQIPYAFAVIWCVKINGISETEFGILTAVEMLTAMLIYIPIAYLADKTTKKPFVVATFAFFTLFPLALLLSHSFWAMAVAFVIRGMKEFGEPTRKALIIDLAPEGQKAGAFGIYYLIRDVVVSMAAFGGALLWDSTAAAKVFEILGIGGELLPLVESITSPTTNLLVAFGFGVLGTIYFALFGTDLKPQDATTPESHAPTERGNQDEMGYPSPGQG
jgi:MFS family permease